jgi:hypothetical protein
VLHFGHGVARECENSACANVRADTIIGTYVLSMGFTTLMSTTTRRFEGYAKAPQALGCAIELGIAFGMRVVHSPVDSGDVNTK